MGDATVVVARQRPLIVHNQGASLQGLPRHAPHPLARQLVSSMELRVAKANPLMVSGAAVTHCPSVLASSPGHSQLSMLHTESGRAWYAKSRALSQAVVAPSDQLQS